MAFTDVLKTAIAGNGVWQGTSTVTVGMFGPVASGTHYHGNASFSTDAQIDMVGSGLDDRFDDITYYNQI
jgi:hypothetical protein